MTQVSATAMDKFRPMLAESVVDLKTLIYPILCSPKFDGFRAIINEKGQLISRRLKRIPNLYARSIFEDDRLIGCDGELIAGEPTAENVFNQSTTASSLSSGGLATFVCCSPWTSGFLRCSAIDSRVPSKNIARQACLCSFPLEVLGSFRGLIRTTA